MKKLFILLSCLGICVSCSDDDKNTLGNLPGQWAFEKCSPKSIETNSNELNSYISTIVHSRKITGDTIVFTNHGTFQWDDKLGDYSIKGNSLNLFYKEEKSVTYEIVTSGNNLQIIKDETDHYINLINEASDEFLNYIGISLDTIEIKRIELYMHFKKYMSY